MVSFASTSARFSIFGKSITDTDCELKANDSSIMSEISVHKLAEDPCKCFEERKKYINVNRCKIEHPKQEVASGFVRIVCISDTHNQTDNLTLPNGDILIHGGDFTWTGLPEEVDHFNKFLARVKHQFKHIVVIAGNHELTFDSESYVKPGATGNKFRFHRTKDIDCDAVKKSLAHCIYLEDESCQLMGLKIYGSPWQPEFRSWGFNLPRGQQCLDKWNMIPDDVDVLVTHGPPLGIGDFCKGGNRAGCSELLTTIKERVKPNLHVFGHIHEDYGLFADDVTIYANASICNQHNYPSQKPIVVDVPVHQINNTS